jgi:hypothetical protein
LSNQDQNPKKAPLAATDAFWLTDLYPDAAALFSHQQASLEVIIEDCIVILDANVLLWPFELENASVEDIAKVYKTLAAQNRLVVPGQAAREYYKHRSQKVAALTGIWRAPSYEPSGRRWKSRSRCSATIPIISRRARSTSR